MNKNRVVFFGALIGAATGAAAALLLERRAKSEERAVTVTSSQGLKIGLLLFGLLRAIAMLGEEG